MANANKNSPNWETLGTAGAITPNSVAKLKELYLTANVTLNIPDDVYPTDEYEFHIKLNAKVLTLASGYVSVITTPPTILENSVMHCRVMPDKTVKYWLGVTGA